MSTITILGAGSWALGLALLLHNNGHEVTIWSAVPEEIEILRNNHENPKYLPGIIIPEDIKLSDELETSVRNRDVIVMAVASKFIRSTAERITGYLRPGQVIVNVAKGLESGTLFTPKEIINEVIPQADMYVLSGPSHAEEVSRGLPTVVTIGGDNPQTARYLQEIFASKVFRVYTSSDTLGLELGGALKNVIALAAGIADGLGYGDNTKAALITRGMKEIARLALVMGAKAETLYGLSGMGDLIVTCASMHSRNRRAGILIGQGKTMDEAIAEVHMVVEGIVSAEAARDLAARYNVDMPIVNEVCKVLFDGKSAKTAVDDLMLREYIEE